MAKFIGHFPCISKKCTSSDGLAISVDSEDVYFGKCFVCDESATHNRLSKNFPELDIPIINWDNNTSKELYVEMGDNITQDQRKWVENNTKISGKNFRGITDETLKYFQVRTEYENGEPSKRYYPSLEDGKLVGYKVRVVKDKDFYPVGKVGKVCEFFGQFRHKTPPKVILLTGGEEDAMAAYQMLYEASPKKDGEPVWRLPAVLSSIVGESSCKSQIQENYEWIDKVEKIIICMDNDKAGEKALEAIAAILPEGKVYHMEQPSKDPNKALQDGLANVWVDCYWRHKAYDPLGIKASTDMLNAVKSELSTERLSLPPYMNVMQTNMGGGIRDATILNIIADTSVGKSSHVNNMLYHWVFNSPHPLAIFSLEATEGQWGADMLSLHLGVNLGWMDDKEREEYLNQPEVIEKSNELFIRPDGRPRFYLIDERNGDITKVEKQLERLYKQYNCRLFVIDVLTDLLRGMDADLQESHMKFQKFFVKNGCRIVNVLHTRKPLKNKDGKSVPISEYDAYGSGTFVQSAAINILLERDKEASDDIEKNTTYVRMPKCRGGVTGECGEWYYDWKTRQVHDRGEYFDGKTEMVTEDGYAVEM